MRPRTPKGVPNCQMGYVEIDPSARYGRFRDVLGKGAMKTVYKAFDKVLGMEVAWSQVLLNDVLHSPDELRRLYSEVHLLKNLNHESILQFYHSWIDIDQKTFNFITEMFTSGTLREYRQKYKEVDIKAVKNWARQILRGLVYLHNHDPPIIHRDLKCDNIFVNGHLGQVKIGDLGLAAILHDSRQAHSVIGTPEFMAPELYEEKYNELVDIYSFGMCLLEMLTSEYPYSECSNPAQIYKKVTSGKKPEAFYRIQDVGIMQFIGKCLEVASKRLPAHELLLDPFLATDDEEVARDSKPALQVYSPKGVIIEMPSLLDHYFRSTEMTITGTVNPEHDTVFLKVQLSSKDGSVRNNVHFPFDIINDTVMDVAMEMVEELDIADWEPHEIAEMIEEEISSVVPGWKDLGSLKNPEQEHHFEYDKYDDNKPPPELFSCSSHDSVQGLSYLCDALPSAFCENARGNNHDWLQGGGWLGGGSHDGEDSSSESIYSLGTCSDLDVFPKRSEHGESEGQRIMMRMCPARLNQGNNNNGLLLSSSKPDAVKGSSKCSGSSSSSSSSRRRRCCHKRSNNNNNNNNPYGDMRSQLLHRAVMQALNKRRPANTVAALENIGFQPP